MKIFCTSEKGHRYSSEIFDTYFDNMRIGFFDIETTGLSPDRCKLILAGLAYYEGDMLVAKQIFADDPSEEPEVIATILNELKDFDMVVTYNGKRFDMPFLLKRAYKNKIHMNEALPYNLDLYPAVRSFSPLRAMLPDLKQKTVESFVGLWETRTDEISGAESVELYYYYAGTKDEKIRDVILLHNRDDIMQLSKLLTVLDKCDLNGYIYANGLPAGRLIIGKITAGRQYLDIIGTQRNAPADFLSYDDFCSGYKVWFKAKDSSFVIRVPVIENSGLRLVDLKKMNIDYSGLLMYPNVEEDYLIVSISGKVNHREVNLFSQIVVKETERLLLQGVD